ncbi:MAG: ABC transporter ATP-binding protein [Mycoplasmataceae bacterium]|nr:ABC transporter ATP-binding protein [Mycoplasmataceae bacterium]
MINNKPIVSFNRITKTFGDNVANDSIDFDVHENEIHAILGENGAGKSTLMSILFGLYKPTSGFIKIRGKRVKITDPRHANELKIAMLPQHFKLVENMTGIQNVILGYEKIHKNKGNVLDVADDIARTYKLEIDLKKEVGKMTISEKQNIEILKILWRESEIIIFDEPTSILTAAEIKVFLEMVLFMKEIGKTIILITHKLPEITKVADRVTIIRKGSNISTKVVSKIDEKEMAKIMVGKEVNLNLDDIERKPVDHSSKDILLLKGVNYKAVGYESNLRNINLSIQQGEIVGIAAIDGNGQSELIQAIAGMLPVKGKISVDGVEVQDRTVHNRYYDTIGHKKMDIKFKNSFLDSIRYFKDEYHEIKNQIFLEENKRKKAKLKKVLVQAKIQIRHAKILYKKPRALISHIPEDRHKHGLVLDYSVANNSVLQDIDFYTRWGFVNYKDINSRMDWFKEKYDIRGVTTNNILARKLSGGNQQKLILAREIERGPKLLLASHPTRGLDVGAVRQAYESIIDARNKGMAVLLNSGELEEIMQISDRIIVMYEGKIVSTSKRGKLSKSVLGSLMAGGRVWKK